MKKILSVLLVLTLVFAFGAIASADEATELTKLGKTYTVIGSDAIDAPVETLEFEIVADEGNPDGTLITLGSDEEAPNTVPVDGSASELDIKINLPTYTKVGIYNYTITEKAGTTQGVTYSEETIAVVVLAEYDYTGIEPAIVATAYAALAADAKEKLDEFTNEYGLGTLTVNKTVTGNLADQDKLFTIKVTLEAEEGLNVNSDITVFGGSDTSNAQTIEGAWTGSKEITIKLKHGETVTIADIPAGISYTVEEDASHLIKGDAPTPEELNGEEGYKVTYTDETGEIEADDTAEAKIVNEKKTEIQTGIVLDSLPYILLAVLAIAAVAVLIIRKRRYSEE